VRPTIEKRRVPISRFSADELPAIAVIVLTLADQAEAAMRPLERGRQMAALKHYTYRPGLAVSLGVHEAHFHTIAGLAAHSRMWHVTRPRRGGNPLELAAMVEEAIA
jgi:hypothetical protein